MGNLPLDPLGLTDGREKWKQIRVWNTKVRAFELWGGVCKRRYSSRG
jgi:hypothetical protein